MAAQPAADLDALTGLGNHRFFHEALVREVSRAQRESRRLALLVLDLDDFKAINDLIDNLAGDSVLVEVANRLRSVLRAADIACRVGGDEFAIILPESGVAEAEQLYRRLPVAVGAPPFGGNPTLALSAGIAELREQEDAQRLLSRAGLALHDAKQGPPPPVEPSGMREPRRPRPPAGAGRVSRRIDDDED